MRERIRNIILNVTSTLSIRGKCGKLLLQPTIAAELSAAGYTADVEDTKLLLCAGLPVWRSKDNGDVEATLARRLVDIVVYDHGRLVALIETESDLNDLRGLGVTKRSGHYDVWSIARSESADFFHSYKSLERMAATAFYVSLQGKPNRDEAVAKLSAVRSNVPRDHNPLGIHLFLVSGKCRSADHEVLASRLQSLDAELVCVRQTEVQQSVPGRAPASRERP